MSGMKKEIDSLLRDIQSMTKLDLLQNAKYQNVRRNKKIARMEMEYLRCAVHKLDLYEEIIFWSLRLLEKDHKLNHMLDIFNKYCKLSNPIDYEVAEMIRSHGQNALCIDVESAKICRAKFGIFVKSRIYLAMVKALEYLGRHSEIMKLYKEELKLNINLYNKWKMNGTSEYISPVEQHRKPSCQFQRLAS